MPPAIFIFLFSLPPPRLLRTRSSIDFLPTPPVASSPLQFFFPPRSIFSVQLPRGSFLGFLLLLLLLLPTLPSRVSWRLTLICTSPEPLCRKAGSRGAAGAAAITWPDGGLLQRLWNQRNVFRQDHFSGVLVIFLLAELHTSNFFLWVYTNQVSPFYAYSGFAAFCWHFQLFLSCTGILLVLRKSPCKSLSTL